MTVRAAHLHDETAGGEEERSPPRIRRWRDEDLAGRQVRSRRVGDDASHSGDDPRGGRGARQDAWLLRCTVLEETKMRPENLTLEVTESLAINDIGRMKKVLSKIKELGALIALDDFGTGYSSLSHIRELPIDIIKIDRCFVIDLGKDDYAETFVRMVAELADTIGVRMCVEGVEYDEQLQILKDMKKVQYIQGYYYDKPLTEEAFEKKYL